MECGLQVEGCAKVRPIANEDLQRETEEKTSAVHFLRFELNPDMVEAVKEGAQIAAGIDHPAYQKEVQAPKAVCESLAADLD